ncbi:SciE type virulence protein [Candidatus Binatia bacterium]|nr:SciE type virulence protein [Candidatus Binatia bacterium]
MDAGTLFQQGNLGGAVDAATRDVKARPTELRHRTFLFELLCFAGDFERAARQLDVVGHQDASTEPAVQVYRNILHAERLRRRLYTESLRPEFLLDPPPFTALHLEAIGQLRSGDPTAARATLECSEETRTGLRGRIGDAAFDGFRDCDDLVAPFLELIVVRDYVWVPFEQIRVLDIAAPERPRDLLWIPARLELVTGAQYRGYVPVLYEGSHAHADDQVKLGRRTEWLETPEGPVRGVGQRTFLAGEDPCAVLDIRHVEISPS